MWVRLFGVEAVAAVVLEEEGRETEVVADGAGRVDGLVGEDSHEDFGVGGADGLERGEDTWVEKGVVELMDAVVVEKECNCFSYVFFVVDVAFGIADGAADKHGGAVADVVGDDGFRQLGFAEVG